MVIAIPYFSDSLQKSSLTKLKADLLMIQNGINQYNNKQVIEGTNETLDSLDEDSTYLFSKILPTPIITSKNNSWKKIDENKYLYLFSNNKALEFIYDDQSTLFMCNKKEELCKEVLR